MFEDKNNETTNFMPSYGFYNVKQPPIIQSTDIAALLLKMHALGGDYMKDAQYNIKFLARGGEDFFIRMNKEMLIINSADTVYRQDTHEFEMWMRAEESPEQRTFHLSLTGEKDGHISGSLLETDLYKIQDSIRLYSFYITHLDAQMKDGSQRHLTLAEWDAMGLYERDQLLSWAKYYDPADEAKLAAYLKENRNDYAEYQPVITAEEFLIALNADYMSRANNPQPEMLRLTQQAANEMLALDIIPVYRLTDKGADKLSPIDAAKTGLWYSVDREFAVKTSDLPGINKWAQRTAAEILRQAERGTHKRDRSEEH